MAKRINLQKELEEVLGSRNVYFQPPEDVKMEYPCIVYHRQGAATDFADNIPYKLSNRYKITVIDRNPDTEIPDKVAMFPTCVFDTSYSADNLNHYILYLYY